MPILDSVVEALHQDVKGIQTDVRNILVVQERQTGIQERFQVSMDEHMRRTDLLEKTVRPLTEREISRAALTRVFAAIGGLLVAGAAAVEILFHLVHLGH